MTPIALLSSPSASPFLEAFRPLPAAGCVSFPSVSSLLGMEPPSHLLQKDAGALFRTCARFLIADAGAVLAENFSPTPHALSATGGSWSIEEFADFGGGTGFARFLHDSGRFLFLAGMGSQADVFAGKEAHGVLCGLSNAVGEDGGVSTAFHFAFFDHGVARLRASLKRESAPLFEVALALADLIAISGQFSSEEEARLSLVDVRGRSSFSLGRAGRRAELPDALFAARQIEVSAGGDPETAGGVLIPDALSQDGREYLSIVIKNDADRDRGETTALCDVLENDLWNFAMMLSSGWELGSG